MIFHRTAGRRNRVPRRCVSVVSFFVLALLLLFSSQDIRGAEESKKDSTKGPHRTLTYVSAPPGTGHYSMAVGQAQLLSRKGLQVVVQPAPGSLVIPDLVASKEVDLAIGSSPTVYWAYEGKEEFKKPYKFIRLLMVGSDLIFSIVTRSETGIKTIPDLKGKRLTGEYPTARFQTVLTELELQAYGLSRKDVIMRKAEFSNTALDDLASKRTDAVQVAIIGPRFQELATKVKKIVVLPVDEDKVNLIKKTFPMVMPGRTQAGLPVDAGVPGIAVPALLYAGETLTDETAYFIVKTLLENQKELIPVYREFIDWTPQKAVRNLGMPYHPGAIRYYREKGLWTADMEKMQQALLGR
jgi:uncharacterized protein